LALAPGLMACLLAVSSCEEPSPQQRVENAQAFLERGNAQLAIAELKRVLQEQPDDADARVMLGKIYLTGGELPYAEKELERAKALGIDSAELMVTLGELWLKQGRREHLLTELNAPEDWPQDARITIHELRARAFLDLDDLAGARRAYEAILRIDPGNLAFPGILPSGAAPTPMPPAIIADNSRRTRKVSPRVLLLPRR
jgi:tetratricopeptide (TPR) repeat protein